MDIGLIPQHDDDGIWDELSHQQTREIEQHNSRVAAASRRRTVPVVAATWSAMVAATTSAVAAAQHAWREAQLEHVRRRANDTTRSNAYHAVDDSDLGEFGLGIGPSQALSSSSAAGQHEEPLLAGEEDFDYDHPRRQAAAGTAAEEGNFVFLKNVQWMPQREGWGVVSNLDLFFTSLYNYYYHRGFWPMVGKSVVEVVTLFFTLWLSIFLFAKVDWVKLRTCVDESSCHDQFHEYLIPRVFRHHSALWSFWIVLYSIFFFVYGAFCLWTLFHTIQDAWEAKYVFEEKLGIAAHTLEGGAVDWERHVVDKLLQLQASRQYRIVIQDGPAELLALDALVVAQRIMRKENFLIAFFNQASELLPLNPFSNVDNEKPMFQHQVFFCKSLEWSLYFCILNFMFNHKYQIRPAFYLDPSSLRRRFRLCGICHAIFLPFLLFFMTLHFLLQNVYEWKSTKQYLGPREWSSAAKWTFREFNELPHVFERRLGPSYEAAENYLKLFRQDEIITSIGRILVFVGGSLGVVLLGLWAINDAILLHVRIGNYNLLWFVGATAVIYSTGKALIPNPQVHLPHSYNTRNLHAEMSSALAKVATQTHYFPDSWKRRAWDKNTAHKAFSAMFQYKAQLFAMEIMSVIVATYLLCVSLPANAERICEFVLATRTEVAGIGDVCGYGTFDFDKFGDENWEGRTMGRPNQHDDSVAEHDQFDVSRMTAGSLSASILQIGNVDQAKNLHPTPKARRGKMEKSFFNFKAAHPNWKCSASGQSLLDRVHKYQQDETAALSRERQLYIEAAARQLDMLAQLEQQNLQQQQLRYNAGLSPTFEQVVDEAYLAPNAGADIGGGGVIPAETSSASDSMTTTSMHHTRERGVLASSLTSPSRVTFEDNPLGSSAPNQIVRETPDDMQPPFAQAPSQENIRQLSSTLTPTVSSGTRSTSIPAINSGALSIGLSTELRRILNMSTLDPDVSVAGSVLGGTYDPSIMSRSTVDTINAALATLVPEAGQREGIAERQYLWLERYHAHLSQQRQQQPDAQQPSSDEQQSNSPYMQDPSSFV